MSVQNKIRRWTFIAKVVRDGKVSTFQPPALTIGNRLAARKAANEMLANITETDARFAGCQVTVDPEAHEVVSESILNQINGLEQQTNMIIRALKSACTRIVTLDPAKPESEEEFNNAVTALIGEFALEQQALMEVEKLTERGIDPSTIVPEDQALDLEGEFAGAFTASSEDGPKACCGNGCADGCGDAGCGKSAPAAELAVEPFPDGVFAEEVAA
jgi:hypothetical protein